MYSSNSSTSERPQGSADVPVGEDRTRDRVLATVLEDGPISAAELGKSLQLTPAAVRRHLDALTERGLIEVKSMARQATGAGRPARRYVVSQGGQERLGDDYLPIAVEALRDLETYAGKEAVDAFVARRFEPMEKRYSQELEGIESLEDRAEKIAELLSADGFVGYTREAGLTGQLAMNQAITPSMRAAMAAVQLCQGHCPVLGLAKEFPQFCEHETGMFSRLLGVDVRRLSTLATGGHVCTTHIPLGRFQQANPGEKRVRVKSTRQEKLR
ncbi:helix-turn-helix transcriptional regulator [Neomicrococcus aestuarii]|uniref:ArsR family transcriptional regulator n=1 Tax=Neomicrococcus aestuarii TaxID=556325 RepID=A0A1L2ZMD5_9MICC|nr:winged helix-turn-helix transcriptional regulator [Neomicrococcus aestuarii]APF40178.1 ArsR family transcriptional regulator [Neomicrococcus aestuarii]